MAVAEANVKFREIEIADPVPTGRQLREAAGFRPTEDHLLLQLLERGALEDRRLDETAELRRGGGKRFIQAPLESRERPLDHLLFFVESSQPRTVLVSEPTCFAIALGVTPLR